MGVKGLNTKRRDPLFLQNSNAFLASPLKLRVSLPDMFYVYYIYKHIYTLFRYIQT